MLFEREREREHNRYVLSFDPVFSTSDFFLLARARVTMGVSNLVRLLWPCYKTVKLAEEIKGKIIAVDASVFLHAIASDVTITELRQANATCFVEVFAYLNIWYANKKLWLAKAIVFVFDCDLKREFHCDKCKELAEARLDDKNSVAGAERRQRREVAQAAFKNKLSAFNAALKNGHVDTQYVEEMREELRKLAGKFQGRGPDLRLAMLVWITQHNNALARDAHGASGGDLGGKKKRRKYQQNAAAKRRQKQYDVKRKLQPRSPIEILVAQAEADDCIARLCQTGVVDIGLSVDTDHIVWGCPKMILNGVNDRRKQDDHKVSVVDFTSVEKHVVDVLLNVSDKEQRWRSTNLFNVFKYRQQKEVRGRTVAMPHPRLPEMDFPAVTMVFEVDENLKRNLEKPGSGRLALLVVATFLGTDFCKGILNVEAAVMYTAWFMQCTSKEAQDGVLRAAWDARTLNKAYYDKHTDPAPYMAQFRSCLRHFHEPFGIRMARDSWKQFLFRESEAVSSSGTSSSSSGGSAKPLPGCNYVNVVFPCQKQVTNDPKRLARLLRFADLTAKFKDSKALEANFEIPCQVLNFEERDVQLWPTVVLAYYLRARGCDPPSFWKRDKIVQQVETCIKRHYSQVIQKLEAARQQQNDGRPIDLLPVKEPLLKVSHYFANYYHKLMKRAFLPYQQSFDNSQPDLQLSERNLPKIRQLMQCMSPSIEEEVATFDGKLSEHNQTKAHGYFDAGFYHWSFFTFMETTFDDGSRPDQDVIIVRCGSIASYQCAQYSVRVAVAPVGVDGKWEAVPTLKYCQCVTGSELNTSYCAHMAGCWIALDKIRRNIGRTFEALTGPSIWPEDILLMQAQPIRLAHVMRLGALNAQNEGDDELNGENADDEATADDEVDDPQPGVVANAAVKRSYNMSFSRGGPKSLTKQETDEELGRYIAAGHTDLLRRDYMRTAIFHETSGIDPTDHWLNTEVNEFFVDGNPFA